ncbi:MotA/TolQ/ExbB proton channel [Solidesulfovibrio carbinoliphilus subsp. oakridgensis]|uniref:MotA/TolQ/ExbB proton channel n=1 Tax=Solidesulfovibrio carbinoliphilus subsp. oakridgensis TaxID=694327 RepID=G7Q5Q8_9BACT|nr:MotA/TolQ/ExbB proton channel family protein [Solidesulfovibrio carbinoliphilus]EHJ49617.1 MotA/TolQ/ExbB proton channel [Solidesulfovibrio carbinoliphilus subsp. oakridgensis]
MNIATVIGIVFGITILGFATFLSTDSAGVFINFPGLAIVLGGTLASTFICFPLKEVMRVFNTFLIALKREELPTDNYIEEIVEIARHASTRGTIHLEKALPGIENEFLQSAIQMLVDGYSREEIQEILDTRIEQTYQQELSSAGIYRTMAKLAPAYGMIGTLIGLIGMMQSMSVGLGNLGAHMAVALTTTLYGILLANLILLPIAIKVEKRIEERIILMCVIRDGTLFIKDKTPAAIVLDKLKAYLPTRRWSSIERKDKEEVEA